MALHSRKKMACGVCIHSRPPCGHSSAARRPTISMLRPQAQLTARRLPQLQVDAHACRLHLSTALQPLGCRVL